VAGLFGMNVKVPFVMEEVNTLWPFFGIVAGMVIASVIFIAFCIKWKLF
jgi:Mg2+ and Co2+ transporter CorA